MICGPSSVSSGSISDMSTTWPRPVSLARAQRDQDRERGRERRDAVGERERRQQRRAVRLAVQRGEAAHRLGQRAEAGPRARTGPVWPKPLTRASTRRGLTAESSSQPSAPPLERPRPEVLEHDVGPARPAAGRASRPSGCERSSVTSRLLRAERLEPEPDAVLARAVPARGVGARRVLDLDHVRAVVAEEHRRRAAPRTASPPRRRGSPSSGLVTGRPPGGSRSATSAGAAAGEQQLQRELRRLRAAVDVPVGAFGAASRSRPSGSRSASARRSARSRSSSRRAGPALEQAGLGGELPLVLGRQPRAERGGVHARLGERTVSGRRRVATSRTRDREPAARRRRARPRRNRAAAAAAASTPRRTALRRRCPSRAAEDRASSGRGAGDRDEALRHRVERATGRRTRTVSRAGNVGRAAAGDHDARRPTTAAIPRGGSSRTAARGAERTSPSNGPSPRFASAHSVVVAVAASARRRPAGRRCARRAASTRRA